MLHCCFY